MSVSGPCGICERAPARHTCGLCGQQVCHDHWSETAGACSPCAEGRSSDDSTERDDGTDGFRID
ncbi:hypothetical protein [Halorubrum sp. DTA98]|uniref:hypothetical protein n=1 Tax=Halorubrum sp. DTA98 TaxID=3402163 RepID=UPI003AAEB93F